MNKLISAHFFLLVVINISVNAALMAFFFIDDLYLLILVIGIKDLIITLIIFSGSNKRMFYPIVYISLIIITNVDLCVSAGFPRMMADEVSGRYENLTGKVTGKLFLLSETIYEKNDIFSDNGASVTYLPHRKTCVMETRYGKMLIIGLGDEAENGDIYEFEAKISGFDGKRNPGGFDEKIYYAGSGIYLKAIIADKELIQGSDAKTVRNLLIRSRNRMIKGLHSYLPEKQAGLVTAIRSEERRVGKD